MQQTLMISVLILTRNEEQDLPACLDSVAWSDDVHVFDSLSTDRTVEIARQRGAQVTQRAFDNWAAHQNWALSQIPFKYPWVFYLDADERMTPTLIANAQAAVEAPSHNVAFRVQRRDFFLGQWLKHAQLSAFYLRLFRPERMRYERLVNPISIPDGAVGDVGGYLDHYPFSKGTSHWLLRHNSYSTLEAEQIISSLAGQSVDIRSALFARDFHAKRRAQKALFYRMPARPLIKWAYMMFGRGAVLDGAAGIAYANLQAVYEYMIVLKTREMLRGQLTAPAVGAEKF